MDAFDATIHQPARLQIMSALTQLGENERVDFSFLKDRLALTDGNLGAHLTTLEARGYIAVSKQFMGRKPKTYVKATIPGRQAFAGHVAALNAMLSHK